MFEDGDFGKYPKGLNILIFSRGHLLYCSWVCFGNSRLLTLPGELTPYVVIYDVNSSQNIVDVRPSHLFDHVPIVGSLRNRYGRCILGRVTILDMFRG